MRLGTPLSAALNGWAERQNGDIHFSAANWDIHFLRVKGSNPFPRRAARPGRLFLVTGPRGPGYMPRPPARPGLGIERYDSMDRADATGRVRRDAAYGRIPPARSGRSPFTTANWDIHFLRVPKDLILFPALRGSPRPSVSVTRASRPGLHAAAADAAGPRNRAIRLHGSCGCNGPRPADAAYGRIPPRAAAVHRLQRQIGTSIFFVSKALILFPRRCAARPGRLFPVTRASRGCVTTIGRRSIIRLNEEIAG